MIVSFVSSVHHVSSFVVSVLGFDVSVFIVFFFFRSYMMISCKIRKKKLVVFAVCLVVFVFVRVKISMVVNKMRSQITSSQ